MIGERERGRDVGRPRARRPVDAGLERIAPAAAEPLRQCPIGAAAGEREADERLRRQAIVESGGDAPRARGEIVRADHQRIAARLVIAAVRGAPRGPARLVDQRRRLVERRLQHLGISERDIVGDVGPLRREPDRRPTGAADAGAPVDERIEHDAEELAAELKDALLRAGRRLARDQRQRVRQVAAGQAEQVGKARRQRAARVEKAVDRVGDVLLVLIERRPGAQRRGIQIEEYVGRTVAQAGAEIGIAQRHAAERGAAKPAGGVHNIVAADRVAARRQHRLDGAPERRRGDVGEARRRWADLHQVERARLEGEIACNRHRRAGHARSRRKDAAAVNLRVADGAGAAERAAVVHRHRAQRGQRTVHDQRAAIHRRRAGIGVDAGERQRAGAFLGQRSADPTILQNAGERGRQVVAAHLQILRAEADRAGALDRAGRDAGTCNIR